MNCRLKMLKKAYFKISKYPKREYPLFDETDYYFNILNRFLNISRKRNYNLLNCTKRIRKYNRMMVDLGFIKRKKAA